MQSSLVNNAKQRDLDTEDRGGIGVSTDGILGNVELSGVGVANILHMVSTKRSVVKAKG